MARTSCGRESHFDAEPEVVCVLAKALEKKQQHGIRRLKRPIVHLRIGSGFKGVGLSRFCTFCHQGFLGYCLVADKVLHDGA